MPGEGPRGGPEAVFFDVGATLIRPRPSMGRIYERVLSPMGAVARPAEYESAFGITWAEMDEERGNGRDRFSALPGGEMAFWREYVRRVLDRLEAPIDVDEATGALHAEFASPRSWQVFPDVAPAVRTLGEAGLRLGVISNWDSRLPNLLEGLGLDAHFEPVVYSAAAGEEKPSRGIFEEALRRAGVPASRAVHVGDSVRDDFEGAEGAGLTGVVIDRAGEAPGGVRRVSSLEEMAARILRGEEPGRDGAGAAGGSP